MSARSKAGRSITLRECHRYAIRFRDGLRLEVSAMTATAAVVVARYARLRRQGGRIMPSQLAIDRKQCLGLRYKVEVRRAAR